MRYPKVFLTLFLFLFSILFLTHFPSKISAADCTSTDPANPCPNDWLCFHEYGNGDGQNGFYKADFDPATGRPTGAKIKAGYCGRNFQCISATERRRLSLQINPDSPCYAYCICAIGALRHGYRGGSFPYIKKTDGTNVVDDNGGSDNWGYYCGNGDTFPSDYKDGYTDDPKNIIQPKAMCNAPTICQPFVDINGSKHDGMVQFSAINGSTDCPCDTSAGQSFTCFGSQHRRCGGTQICDKNITWGWPCRNTGSDQPEPTPPTPACTDPNTPDSFPSQSGTSSFVPTNTPFPLPCLEGIDATNTKITGPSDKIITCTKYASGVGDINTNVSDFLGTILALVLGLSGGTAVLLIIFSGYQLSISQGNPEKVKEARERLTAAIVGLLFIIFSAVILEIIGVNILQLGGFVKFQ